MTLVILASILMLAFFHSSCTNATDWYPTGSVEIMKYRVYDDPTGVRNCTVFYKIENTGQSKINQSTISVKVKTDKGEYFTTAIDTTVILPGKDVYGSISISFFDNLETVDNDTNVKVIDYFFE